MRVLVTGGTGVVGKPAVDELLRRGHQVRLLSRGAEEEVSRWAEGVEAYPASVGDAESLRGAAAGCDAVLHIAGIVKESPPEVTFEKVNVEGTRLLLEEAWRSGARRFVYVSSLGADRGSSDYHRSKAAAEEAVRTYPGNWLIVRPGNVYGPGDEVISLLLKMVRTLPAIPLVGNGEHAFQPIWAGDLALALANAIEKETPTRIAYDLAGEEITNVVEILDRLERITGKNPVRVPVPAFAARFGAQVAETVGVDLPVGSDQLVMLVEENVLPPGTPNALVEVFGVTPTPLEKGLTLLSDALPERLPEDGTGPLQLHRYWAEIRGSRYEGDALFELFRKEFPRLTDQNLMQAGVEPGSAATMEEGQTVTLAIPMRGNIQVRVEEVTDREAVAVTLQGHPLSGAVRFMVQDEPGVLRFEVRTYTRASTIVDRIAMSALGEQLKGSAWVTLVENVVERSGGEIVGDGVQTEVRALDEAEAESVEAWIKTIVHRRERSEG